MYNVTDDKIETVVDKKCLSSDIWDDILGAVLLLICFIPLVVTVYLAVEFFPAADAKSLEKIAWVGAQIIAYALFGFLFFSHLYEFVVSFLQKYRYVRIDSTGVHFKYLFFKQHIRFEDIKDYGLSYVGKEYDFPRIFRSRYRFGLVIGRIYKVYFSTRRCDADLNTGKKKLRGVKVWWLDVCSLTVHPDAPEGPLFLESVFNFCEAKTGIKPFVPGNVHDFVYREPKIQD